MAVVTLAPVMDVIQAEALKSELIAAFAPGETVTIQAEAVQKISSLCLQLLAAASLRGAVLADPSASFRDSVTLLGLADHFGIAA